MNLSIFIVTVILSIFICKMTLGANPESCFVPDRDYGYVQGEIMPLLQCRTLGLMFFDQVTNSNETTCCLSYISLCKDTEHIFRPHTYIVPEPGFDFACTFKLHNEDNKYTYKLQLDEFSTDGSLLNYWIGSCFESYIEVNNTKFCGNNKGKHLFVDDEFTMKFNGRKSDNKMRIQVLKMESKSMLGYEKKYLQVYPLSNGEEQRIDVLEGEPKNSYSILVIKENDTGLLEWKSNGSVFVEHECNGYENIEPREEYKLNNESNFKYFVVPVNESYFGGFIDKGGNLTQGQTILTSKPMAKFRGLKVYHLLNELKTNPTFPSVFVRQVFN